MLGSIMDWNFYLGQYDTDDWLLQRLIPALNGVGYRMILIYFTFVPRELVTVNHKEIRMSVPFLSLSLLLYYIYAHAHTAHILW